MIGQDSLNHGSAADPTEEDPTNMIAVAEALLQLSTAAAAPPEVLNMLIQQVSRGKEIAPPEAKLVMQKQLSNTDLDNRLLFSLSQIKSVFLTEEEGVHLRGRTMNNGKNHLEVKIMAPVAVKLAQWDSGKSYVINGKWNDFVKKSSNNLRAGMVVQLWCFRLKGELCFALLPVDP